MTQPIDQELRHFIIQNFLFGQDDGNLGNSDSFLEKGIIDSTGVLELVAHLEERYGIAVSDDELAPENLDSLDRLTAFIEKKRIGG